MTDPDQLPALMSDAEIEIGRKAVFSTENPFCPCDSKTFAKAARWAEARTLATERARADALQAERDYLARHIERRSEGMDPMTQMLRARADALEAALQRLLSHPSDAPEDATWTDDGQYFLTPLQHAERAARALLEKKT